MADGMDARAEAGGKSDKDGVRRLPLFQLPPGLVGRILTVKARRVHVAWLSKDINGNVYDIAQDSLCYTILGTPSKRDVQHVTCKLCLRRWAWIAAAELDTKPPSRLSWQEIAVRCDELAEREACSKQRIFLIRAYGGLLYRMT